ncbi:MAG: ABC transporter permease [Telmatospirillum sp.]|nr:ABC transporter permease [Telmatospirillum sp.]
MGGVGRALADRLLQALFVALLVGVLCFFLAEALPGDQAFRIAAARYGEDMVSGIAADAVRAELGLDRPAWLRLADWLLNIARIDLGVSLVSGESVFEELVHQLGSTIGLSLAALALSALVGPPLGVFFALRAGKLPDAIGTAAAAALRALPSFAVGIALMLVFASWLAVVPAAGYDQPQSWLLPTTTLALGLAATSSIVSRQATLAVLQSSQIAFARTKGLGEFDVVRRHAVRNAAAPVVAYLGVQLVYLVEGVVVVESLFAWPGIGHALVHAVIARDIPMLQGTALAMGLLFVLLNAAVDFACRAIDPRVRHA